MLWTPILLILGLVAVIVIVSLLLAREPPDADGSAGMSALDRFLADARGDRQSREGNSAQAIPSPRPRQRGRPAPRKAVETPEPVPPPPPLIVRSEPPPVIIRQAPEHPVTPLPPVLPAAPPVPQTRPRAPSATASKLTELLRDRDSVRAAFLLNEILQPPRTARRRSSGERWA